LSLYQEINAFPNTSEYLATKVALRDRIIQTAPVKKQKDFLTDFAQLSLYDIWQDNGKNKEMIKKMESQIQEYIQQGADKNLIDLLETGFTDKKLSEWNEILDGINQKTLDTLGKENYLEKVAEGMNRENVKKINDQATQIREGLWGKIRALFQ